jgi:hypothetical protein
LIRKKKEIEAKLISKPTIDPGSKKIMDKKQGFVKPIYQRAKEIEDTKKTKVENLKKTAEEKKAKLEEESMKSVILNNNKHFDKNEFSKWRQNTLEWQNKKNQKIESEKEKMVRQQEEELSKYHIPNIHKNEAYRSKMDTGVHDKLYSMKDDKHKKIMQKMIETLPEFKPTINKRLPKYIQKKKENSESTNISLNYNTNTPKVTSKTKPLAFNEVMGNVSKTESKKVTSALAYHYNTANNTINSEEEPEDEEIELEELELPSVQDEIISQYKQALEMASKINLKGTLKNVDKF